jgi:hypothetical protein
VFQQTRSIAKVEDEEEEEEEENEKIWMVI